ncbi:STAS domain-containing protein [Nonomuraea turcica]|uniref:STAS domain-containing protein n=1 Tax=Nonomuraea sp. G32 TaxID=3067274 RepID=UPI00273AFCD5|nr:STAS domain-containing protein [Nonomuraea sp. G32]MDP4511575.1 STAS domain-containing protein [Nonomuraea sp. G32]
MAKPDMPQWGSQTEGKWLSMTAANTPQHPQTMLRITAAALPNGVLLLLQGEFNAAGVAIFTQEIDNALHQHPHPRVVVELSKLAFCDDHGLRAMIIALQRVRASGGEFMLASVHGRCRRLLQRKGLNTFFPPA